MKPLHLTLICHALTDAQRTGYLSSRHDTILPLAALPWSHDTSVKVLSAPERRAQETAALLGSPVRLESALADCDLGSWQGLALKQLQAEQPEALAQWLGDPCSNPHGGESFAELRQRVTSWLGAFEERGDWLAVTHPWVIRAVLIEVLGAPLATQARIDVLPLSRVCLSHTGQWRLRLA
ncbi:histidine phosphatase family protein [Enterobacterales bacterium BD_CKDN230030183-1A_HGKHYDSX7]